MHCERALLPCCLQAFGFCKLALLIAMSSSPEPDSCTAQKHGSKKARLPKSMNTEEV